MSIKKERIGRSVGASSDKFIWGSRTKVRVESGTSDEFGVKGWCKGWCASRVCAITTNICYCG